MAKETKTTATPSTADLIKQIVQDTIAAGAKDVRKPIWVATTTIMALPREAADPQRYPDSIVFRTFTGPLADLNGKGLPIRGTGAQVRICIATATEDWEPDEEMKAKALAAGKPAPKGFKKGTKRIRCFS